MGRKLAGQPPVVSADGKRYAHHADATGMVVVRAVPSGEELRRVPGRSMYGLAFSPDGKALALGGLERRAESGISPAVN